MFKPIFGIFQSTSAVSSFTGVLVQADSSSAAFLSLSITGGQGVVTGSLQGAGGAVQVILPSHWSIFQQPLIGQYYNGLTLVIALNTLSSLPFTT